MKAEVAAVGQEAMNAVRKRVGRITGAKRRHSWEPYKGTVERCARPRCKSKCKDAGGRNYVYRGDGAGEWDKSRPVCIGGSTADKGR